VAGDYSFAVGQYANIAAEHDYSFVWSGRGFGTNSWGAGTFTARAPGGVRFYTANTDITSGVELPAGGGSWASLSDRDAKFNFADVDTQAILETLASLPITTWSYNGQDESIRHMGAVAQDFYAAFGIGEDDRHITTVDADGVAFASIQGLYGIVQEQAAAIDALEARVAALESLANGGSTAQAGFGAVSVLFVVLLVYVLMRRRERDAIGGES
jgi:hypothetical protein